MTMASKISHIESKLEESARRQVPPIPDGLYHLGWSRASFTSVAPTVAARHSGHPPTAPVAAMAHWRGLD